MILDSWRFRYASDKPTSNVVTRNNFKTRIKTDKFVMVGVSRMNPSEIIVSEPVQRQGFSVPKNMWFVETECGRIYMGTPLKSIRCQCMCKTMKGDSLRSVIRCKRRLAGTSVTGCHQHAQRPGNVLNMKLKHNKVTR